MRQRLLLSIDTQLNEHQYNNV